MSPFLMASEMFPGGHPTPHSQGNQSPETLNNISEATQLATTGRQIKNLKVPDPKVSPWF